MSEDDVEKVGLIELPDDHQSWSVEQLVHWLTDELETTLGRLRASAGRERALMAGLNLIAFEAEFCTSCGNQEGEVCPSPNRCNFAIGNAQSIAMQTLNVHRQAIVQNRVPEDWEVSDGVSH